MDSLRGRTEGMVVGGEEGSGEGEAIIVVWCQ